MAVWFHLIYCFYLVTYLAFKKYKLSEMCIDEENIDDHYYGGE